MNNFKKFWNKKELISSLEKKYPNYEFNIIVEKTGNNYILIWKHKLFNKFDNKEIKLISSEIFKYIHTLRNKTNISKDKTIPCIFVEHCSKYEYKKIDFPYQENYSDKNIIMKELIDTLINMGNGKNVLKGSVSAYLCYNIGEQIPSNINFSSTSEMIYYNVEMLKNYCNMNGLSFKRKFKRIKNKGDIISTSIKIEDIITITFDNLLDIYPNNEIVILNNIPTYKLEYLIQSKAKKINKKNLSVFKKMQELNMIKKYEEKLKDMLVG